MGGCLLWMAAVAGNAADVAATLTAIAAIVAVTQIGRMAGMAGMAAAGDAGAAVADLRRAECSASRSRARMADTGAGAVRRPKTDADARAAGAAGRVDITMTAGTHVTVGTTMTMAVGTTIDSIGETTYVARLATIGGVRDDRHGGCDVRWCEFVGGAVGDAWNYEALAVVIAWLPAISWVHARGGGRGRAGDAEEEVIATDAPAGGTHSVTCDPTHLPASPGPNTYRRNTYHRHSAYYQYGTYDRGDHPTSMRAATLCYMQPSAELSHPHGYPPRHTILLVIAYRPRCHA